RAGAPGLALLGLGQLAAELLAVDVDRLEVAARVLHAPGHSVPDVVRQRIEEVERLDEMRVAGVGPELAFSRRHSKMMFSIDWVVNRAGVANGDHAGGCQHEEETDHRAPGPGGMSP